MKRLQEWEWESCGAYGLAHVVLYIHLVFLVLDMHNNLFATLKITRFPHPSTCEE